MTADAPPPPFRLRGDGIGIWPPLLLASPHSGSYLPPAFTRTLAVAETAIRRIEDSHVDALLAGITAFPVLEARFSRAVIDVNRAANEFDPQMFDGPLAEPPRPTERVRRGHGLFPRVGANGQTLHQGRLPAASARHLIETVHLPWHQTLSDCLANSLRQHDYAVLLDMHSMPGLGGYLPPQIVLGDRYGRSASAPLVDWLHHRFTAAGWRVARNRPYAGGYTTQFHGRPASGQHAVQIEIDRALYMDPSTLVPHDGLGLLRAFLGGLVDDLIAVAPSLNLKPYDWPPVALAAE